MMETARIVMTSCATKEQAQTIANALVNKRLIACATLLPQVQSIYRWEGKVVDEAETVMLMKTTVAKIAELEKELLSLHPYRTPEFLVIKLEQAGEAYGKWLQSEL